MANWEQWIDDEEPTRTTKKPNKMMFCRKNKQSGKYGPHVYEDAGTICTLCGRLKNKSNITLTKENEEDEQHE